MRKKTQIKKVDPNKFVNETKQKRDTYHPGFKIAITILCCFVGLYVILLIISAFYDYQIDEILAKWLLPTLTNTSIDLNIRSATSQLGQVYTNGPIGRVVESVGTAPCIIVTLAACGIFYQICCLSSVSRNHWIRRPVDLTLATYRINIIRMNRIPFIP